MVIFAGVAVAADKVVDRNRPPVAASTKPADIPKIKIGSLSVEYAKPHAGLPTTPAIMQRFISLRQTAVGLVATQAPGELKLVQLADVADGQPLLSVSAVKDVEKQIVEFITDTGVIGVFVYPKDFDKDGHNLDYLPADAATKPQDLQLVIIVGVITAL